MHRYGGTYRFFDDGKMKDMIPHLIDMGVEVACGLQPPPVGDCVMGELKQEYGDRICLFGGLDPINTFELGSAQTVRAAVTELLEQLGDGRGIVLNTAEAFGPETPLECLQEWIKTVREWRLGRI